MHELIGELTAWQGSNLWYEMQDLHVREIQPQMITLAESYIQVIGVLHMCRCLIHCRRYTSSNPSETGGACV